jgi:hypothetical protein
VRLFEIVQQAGHANLPLSNDEKALIDDVAEPFGMADTVKFSSGLSGGTITLLQGQLSLDRSIKVDASILADGLTIEAFDPSPGSGTGTRVFEFTDIGAGAIPSVSLVGLTIQGGDWSSRGGAVSSEVALSIIECTIRNNSSGDLGGGGCVQP